MDRDGQRQIETDRIFAATFVSMLSSRVNLALHSTKAKKVP